MNAREKQMLDLLKKGREQFNIAAVKAEFEAEGTRHDELLRLLEIARRAGVDVGLKIGGCEAIRDLYEARQFGVDYVIAPMVETPYALTKFIAAVETTYSADDRADTGFLFNVETVQTFRNLPEMAPIAGRAGVGMVFGRVDFAGSLGNDRGFVNSEEMARYVNSVAATAKAQRVDMVMGGGVTKDSIDLLRGARAVRLDRFETRKVIFDGAVLDGNRTEEGLSLAIDFELLWLQNKRDYYGRMAAEDQARIEMMEARQRSRATVRAVA